MKVWIDALTQVLYALLATPNSDAEMWLTGFIAVAVFIVFFNKLSKLLSYPLAAMSLTLCVTVMMLIIALGLGAAAVRFLGHVKFLTQRGLDDWLPLAALLLGTITIGAPALRLITRSRYGPSLCGLMLSLLAVVIVVIVLSGIESAFRSGDRDFGKTRERTETMNRFLGN